MKIKKKNTTIPINGKIVDTDNVEDKTSKAPSMRLVEEMVKDIYSTEEVKIGTWIDGKPLYRKIISSTSPNVTKENENITKKIPVNVDIKFGFIEKAFYKDDSGNIVNIPFIMTGGQVIKAYLNVQDNNIVLTSNTQYTNDKPVSIVINYTKTTD